MGEIHNLQVLISQSPIFKRINQTQQNSAANGSQILNVVEEEKAVKQLSTVRELEETEKTEPEEPRKRRIKKSAKDKLIDRYE